MLYHGSKTLIEGYLEPHVCYELKNWVYATDDYLYALIRCGNFDVTKFLIREDYDDNKYSLAEIVPGAFKYVFDRPGYIYVVENTYFTYNHYTEYVSEKPVPIVRRININNVWNELQKHKDIIEFITYENSDEYWKNVKGGREGYLERKRKAISKMGLSES